MLPERYTDVEGIGHGGMGDIVRAVDTALGRTVAVKRLSQRYAADEAIRARFTREALAASRVSTEPNAVTIYDVGEWEDQPYIVMEYLAGGSLADCLLREGAQPPGRALGWLEGAARALDAAHRQGVVHRDVKPGNLLLDDEGRVKVADFGIASAAGLDPLTQAGTVLGTAGYLAPEQARGEPADPASDRYALGVVAYELLTGRRPFERDSATAEAAAHATDTVPPVGASNPQLPGELDRVFARALAKEPAARYASCEELVADLRAALRREAATTRLLPVPELTAATAAPLYEPRRRPVRRLWPLVAGLAGLLALTGVALASVLANDDPGAEARTIEHTITVRGNTVTVTTTTEAEPPPPPPPSPPPPPASSGGDASALNDEGFRQMQAGDFQRALPLLEQAVAASQGDDSLTEAYASYNLAATRFALGNCDGVLDLLSRSEQVQGSRKEIDRLRRGAERECGGGNEGEGQD